MTAVSHSSLSRFKIATRATVENNSNSFFAPFNLDTTSILVIIVTKEAPLRDGSRSTAGDCGGGWEGEREREREKERANDEDRVKGERYTNSGSAT